MNISSIIIQTKPENIDEVLESIKQLDVCEYHIHDDRGYIIVTIEGDGAEEEMKKVGMLEKIPKVITANMQMSYSEDELDEKMSLLDNQEVVPKMLNDDSISEKDIRYNGDIKGRKFS